MPPSIVEKYEQILAADPKSRIFVELAKALLERGEHARAIEVCSRGLEFHPSSILGRVVWGRALLDADDLKGAMDQFDIAIGLEPASPYAYNLVGEVLLGKELHREALPVLARAAELQPADARVRGWLADAKRRAKESAEARASASEAEDEQTATWGVPGLDAKAAPGPAKDGDDTRPMRAPGSTTATGAEEPAPSLDVGQPVRARTPAPSPRPSPPADAGGEGGMGTTATAAPTSTSIPTSSSIATSTSTSAAASTPDAVAASAPTAPPRLERTTPPPASAPPSVPPPVPAARTTGPRSVLHLIPENTARDVLPSLATRLNIPAAAAPVAAPATATDPAEAERAAAQYERELRERLMAAPEPPPSFVHRNRKLVLAATILVALGAAGGAYLFVSGRNAARAAAGAAAKGRAGLARDTLASLREAQRLLTEARGRSSDPEVGALAAEVAAVLAVEHGDDQARAAARALVDSGQAGDGALAVAWLLAEDSEARAEAEAALLAARPSQGALLQELAGRILVGRGEREGGRGRLDLAASANPPLLRALSDLGDLALSGGDAEGALAYYVAALAAHPTHPRSAVGAAEARLALGRDLEVSRRELDAVDADPGSAPPRDLRVRFEIARARILAALGDAGAAATRLGRVAEKEGESAKLAAALAEIFLQSRSWAQAESAAMRAVGRDPKDPELRALVARARIGRGREIEALHATEGFEGRAVRIQRAIARYRLGQWAEARAELEKTGRDGKLPADAAVWFALVDVGSGKADRALPLLEKLLQANPPPPLASYAQGRALEAVGRTAAAEAAYRAEVQREPLAPEGHAALGRLLLATRRARDAVAPLERAVKLDPSDVLVRRSLAEAQLATGQAAQARAELDIVLLSSPHDAVALRTLSAAWLSEGQAAEARRAADRAVAAAPKDPAVLLAAARAAAASGDIATTKRLGARALKAGATGPDRDEARRLSQGQIPRKK